MSEQRISEPVAAWMECALGRHLGASPVPDLLWERIEQRLDGEKPRSLPMWKWGIAAALLVAVFAGALWYMARGQNLESRIERLALSEHKLLEGHPERLQFHSDDRSEVRDWIRANSGLDVILPGGRDGGVQLVGTCVVDRGGLQIAAIAYRVGRSAATLFVSRSSHFDAGAAGHGHGFTRIASLVGARLFSWHLRDQHYTLVSSSPDTHGGCGLCHAAAVHVN